MPENNPTLLVLPIEEISLQPELSSPPRFRIQGGYPERDGVVGVVVVVVVVVVADGRRHFPFLIEDITKNLGLSLNALFVPKLWQLYLLGGLWLLVELH